VVGAVGCVIFVDGVVGCTVEETIDVVVAKVVVACVVVA